MADSPDRDCLDEVGRCSRELGPHHSHLEGEFGSVGFRHWHDQRPAAADSELAAALLIAYWFRNNSDICHWLKRELADIVLEVYSYGMGSQFDLAKFGTTAELVFQHLLVSGFMLVSHPSS